LWVYSSKKKERFARDLRKEVAFAIQRANALFALQRLRGRLLGLN